MNPIVFAMRHPITVMVALAGVLVASGLALLRMRIDIFPNLNLPVVYVVQPYGGMDPAQMEGLLTFHYENHFLYISGIHHVESRNIQGFAQMKIFFHPGTDMVQAMAEVVAQVNRSRSFMPPGTVAPFVVRFDTGSVPVGYIVLSSKTKSIDEIQEAAYIRVRPALVSLPGVSAPPPFGGNQRTIVIHVNPDKLRSYNLSPNDVVAALTSGNAISPSGNLYLEDSMPIVPVNAMVVDPQELRNIPIRPGSSVYLRDLGTVEDAADIRTSFALVNGRRAVYMMVSKRADASTLAVVNSVKAELPHMQDALPPDIDLRFAFDQSPYVTRAMEGVATEGAIGAVLTGLMVLLFLRDWRSVIVVVLNIPFALLSALVALWLTGQTLNLMTLGGMALAVGILVDEATVAVENIHTQMSKHPSVALAVWHGTSETAVPRLLAMLCILAVFIPSFFMEGAAREMFVPLSLAVGFSMVASYFLSSTFVPVLSVWLLRSHGHGHAAEHAAPSALPVRPGRFSFERLRQAYARFLEAVVLRFRWLVLPLYGIVTVLIVVILGPRCGNEIFPFVDSGQLQLRIKAPVGTRIERTEEIAREALAGIQEATGNRVETSVGFGGVSPSSYTINTVYLWTAGPEEVVLRVALKHDSGIHVEELRNHLRKSLPERLGGWLRRQLQAEGMAASQIDAQVKGLRIGFEPADIINEVMSFGSGKPIEVAVSGPSFDDTRAYAARVREQLARVPSLRDLDYVQTLNYPTVEVQIDRERAGFSGVTASEVAQSLVAATSSSRFVVPNYWRDPKNGVGYQVQVEVPQQRMSSVKEVNMVPVKKTATGQLLLRDVARVQENTMPGEYDRYNMRRVVSMTANIEGEDLGRVADRIDRALAAAGKPPRGVTVAVRGQIVPMRQMFRGLGAGLGMAVVVILLLLTAYFQSPKLAFVAVTTTPAVLAGVVLALWGTGTTLNIQSFMGAIMAIGVAVANAILLVTFAEQARQAGATSYAAAREGGQSRLRPILMTSFAMIAGMLPMALALQEGGEQTAPLGRAVIGGLLFATLATLLVLPAVFAVVQRRSDTGSVSVFPFDPDSRHFTGAQARTALSVGILVVLLGSLGCKRAAVEAGSEAPPVVPTVTTARPERATFHRLIEQPARVEAFEVTPIYAKIPGYVEEVRVEIGTRVRKGALLARLREPELVEELQQKEEQVHQAEKALAVARARVVTSEAQVREAEAALVRVEAARDYWRSQSERFSRLGSSSGVMDRQSVDEALNQYRSSGAAVKETQAKIDSARAMQKEMESVRDKAEADVGVARADQRRVAALLSYAEIRAPFDGIVSHRHVHTGHFLQPAAAGNTGKAQPLFVVVRTDRVRVFLDVPEADAGLVHDDALASIRIPVLNDREFSGKVAGSSWSLDPGQRTLRTEIDFDNPHELLRPGMYAHAAIPAEQLGIFSLPSSSVVIRDGQSFCYCLEDGKAVKTVIRIGAREGDRVEVLKKLGRRKEPGVPPRWEDFSGNEMVIVSNAGELMEGQVVEVGHDSNAEAAPAG